MQASFTLDSNELDHSFVDKLREMFKNKRIELFITETDDTKHLSASAVNKEIIATAIANIESDQNLTVADPKLFQ
jgi:hypothetical protein